VGRVATSLALRVSVTSTDRWCFLGGIDDWFPVGQTGKLADVVRKCAKHLGKDSFFEMT
jgi:hypothetical protein